MKIQIWSDVVCPYCYIGKREFENALAQFPHRDRVEVEWKSFELDREAPVRSPDDMYGMLARKYGRTREQAKEMVAGVVERARTVGLEYNMDKAVMGSSFDAHRLIQYAKTKGKGDAAEERLFRAHFILGEHIGDHAKLKEIAQEIGLDGNAAEAMLKTDAFTEAVHADEYEAQQIGVRGVPFFVLDGKYAVSGAQPSAHFLGALKQAWSERQQG
ncbi:MAG: DsbA family oxidoreductase [Bacteroidetes bacterium]|nr:DsbA family oxidoreductase [Bacteroidota bacterium]MBS1943655.1 DsbA family oxidoreductase [Bacteroidota bacterium]